MRIFSIDNKLVKTWCKDLEEGAMAQVRNVVELPFIFKQLALMPDAHQGYGVPIGSVLATKGAIIPNAVGVDIGCGVLACKISLKKLNKEDIKAIMQGVRDRVPVGFNHRTERIIDLPEPEENAIICQKFFDAAHYQVGTLGGGNHFWELQQGDDGYIWVVIHSGSRNLGKQVADYYNKLAQDLNDKWHSVVKKEWDLAFLPTDTELCNQYIADMNYCLDFARINRLIMLQETINAIEEVVKHKVELLEKYNVHHNYARLENHGNSNVWVHRKGATSARDGEICVIPGSQGTSSYITKGLGNKASFMSCSHGAGRKLGRKLAQRKLSLNEEIEKLNKLGVIHGVRNVDDLAEAAGAYKDIDEVMEAQEDLVEALVKLTPLAVIKG